MNDLYEYKYISFEETDKMNLYQFDWFYLSHIFNGWIFDKNDEENKQVVLKRKKEEKK